MFAKTFLAAAGVTLAAAGAQSADLYPYPTQYNFCPAGLQPVQLGGEISCGVPNQTLPYSRVLAHPAKAPKTVYRGAVGIPLGKGMDRTGTGT